MIFRPHDIRNTFVPNYKVDWKIAVEMVDELNNIPHVEGTQLYGLATDMNYYYRENIDYEDRIVIMKQQVDTDIIEYVEHNAKRRHHKDKIGA